MIVTNKETGKNITRLVINYLEGKLTKDEFEQKTSIMKEKEIIYYCKQGDPYCISPNCRCNTVEPKENK